MVGKPVGLPLLAGRLLLCIVGKPVGLTLLVISLPLRLELRSIG